MQETIRSRWAPILGTLILLASSARADAAGARVRWAPSTDPLLAGYRVYFRPAGTSYGTPINVGKPAPQSDGAIAYVVSGLTAGQTYYFVVTALNTNNLESGFSREVPLGTVNPCLVDHCTSPTACDIRPAADGSSCDDGLFCNGIDVCEGGTCQVGPAPNCDDGVACTTDRCDEDLARCVHVAQSNCCHTDADCMDNDACTSRERCIAGLCVTTSQSCQGTSCAAAYCDPVDGCGVEPTPDGVSCEPCHDLVLKKLILKGGGDSRLNLRGTFSSDDVVNPAVNGLTFEIADARGTVFYSGSVPPDWFRSSPDATKFRFGASADDLQTTNGISGIVLRLRGTVWSLNVRAAANDLAAGLGQSELAATLRLGGVCAADPQMGCQATSSRALCR
jgi:hypothetical protein